MKKLGFVALLLVTLLLAALAATWLVVEPSSGIETDRDDKEFTMLVNFGLAREPVTRSVQLNVCGLIGRSYPECQDPPPTPRASASTATEAPQTIAAPVVVRPEILSVSVEGDLLDEKTNLQFPASQLTLTADNVGLVGLNVTVQANPREPAEVTDGHYEGVVIVERTTGDPIPFRLKVDMEPRTGGPTALALATLALGALMGGTVKWVNDVLSPLTGPRRRWKRLKARLARYENMLPEDAIAMMVETRNAIAEGHASDVADSLDVLVSSQTALIGFARTMVDIQRHIDAQARMGKAIPDPLAYQEAALETERDVIRDLRERNWPWEDRAAFVKSYGNAHENARSLSATIRQYLLAPTKERRVALESLLSQISLGGTKWLSSDAPLATEKVATPEENAVVPSMQTFLESPTEPQLPKPESRRPMEHLLDNAGLIILVMTGLVVVFIGYLTQFVNNTAFTGGLRGFFELLAWAFAVQVTGVTVLDLAGRVQTGTSQGG